MGEPLRELQVDLPGVEYIQVRQWWEEPRWDILLEQVRGFASDLGPTGGIGTA